jgi:hypothetical protein
VGVVAAVAGDLQGEPPCIIAHQAHRVGRKVVPVFLCVLIVCSPWVLPLPQTSASAKAPPL